MKKTLSYKLVLNKEIISRLSNDDLKNIRGASLVNACTMTCSFVNVCCDTLKQCIPPEKYAEG